MIGQTVSHYRILEPLGEGGMGTVYLAEDTHLGRRVAIKFPSISSNSHEHRARFLREARLISDLSHPSIATLFDYGETEEGRPFLVMELVKGRPLTELMKKGELNLLRAVEIVTEVSIALSAANERGIVHRDIKPSNIMIDRQGQVKVLDFGLAKYLNKDHILSSEPEAPTLLSTETQSGTVLGTPAYLSPEQAMGGAVDGRSDLFSMGVVLYEAITGRTPFTGESFIEIAANVLHAEPPPPSRINSLISRELDFITLKALAKKPEKRYQSAKELVDDLNSLKQQLEEEPGQTIIKRSSASRVGAHSGTLSNISQILARPRIPVSYILVGVVIALALGGIAWRLLRAAPYQPSAEAQRWYEVGTSALRDGAYHQASQALERAIAADDAYMLAHARMAEALVELDYVDRAKDELLRVTAADRSALSQIDSLYLDAITATARHDFAKAIELYNQIAGQAADAEKVHVLADLGRAYEKNDNVKQAIQSFTEATNRNSQYATAYLHLGILYGQQGELATALASFDKAESLYQALGNLEGRTEVVFQRGALFNKRNKLSEARSELEKALGLAKANDNKSQTIKTLLQLCSVAFDAGETARAIEYAQEAVNLAQKNGMENLSARGLVTLGDSFLIRGDQAEAEKYFLQALESAVRAKARRNEARARFSLGSLRDRQNNPEEVARYIEPALAFYQQGGYRSETFACLVLLARAKGQKGDYEAALKVHDQLFQLAQELNDQSLVARAHSERGFALSREEKFTESLDHLNQAFPIYQSQGIQRSMGSNLLARGNALWQLGRYSEAGPLVNQAAAIADKPGGEVKHLSLSVKLSMAEMALSQGRFSEARTGAEKVLAEAGTQLTDIALSAKGVHALAQAYGGAAAAGKKEAAEAVETARALNDPAQLASAQLALAETMLLSGSSEGALSSALQAQEVFARLGQQSSEWRALLIAALASRNRGDKTKASEYATQASTSLSKLEQRWGSENYQSYLSRPDIQQLRKQLSVIAASDR